MPTVLSTDAAFSTVAAVRDGTKVDYLETGPAQSVYLEPRLLDLAPWSAHLFGLGDILAVESALRDWSPSPADAHLARLGTALVDALAASAPLLRRPSPDAYRVLADLLMLKVQIGLRSDGPFLEEGTEHYLAYALEPTFTTAVWHGELLLSLLPLCAWLQGWQHERRDLIQDVVAELSIDLTRPPRAVSREEAVTVLGQIRKYCVENNYRNTVLLTDDHAAAVPAEKMLKLWEGGW